MFGTVQDVTERKMAENALSESESRLRLALEAAELGVWDLDLTTDVAVRSLRHDQIWGYDTLQPQWGLEAAMRHVVPEDRPAIDEAYARAAETGLLHHENRVRWPDGSIHWISVHGRGHRNAQGQLVRISGVVADKTERKRAEQAVLESEARFRIAIKNAAIVPAQMDRDLRYQWIYNPHPDFDATTVIGKRDDELEDSEAVRELMALKRRVIESGRGERQTIRFERSDGVRVYDVLVEPLRDAHGAVAGLTSSSFDVTERVLAEAALEAANAALLDSARRKDDFLATLAHELRNPLAPIQSSIDVLRITSGDAAAVERLLPMLQRQTTQLKRLVDDLLDVSRLMRGKIGLQKEPVDLRILVQDVVQELMPSQRNVDIELPAQPLMVNGDSVRLRQIFGNLLNNGIKYTDEGGNIRISLRRENGTAIASVRDDGKGIGHEFLGRIFHAFEQEQSGSEGLGIGLALVRQLAELHGGTAEARSAGPGCGSEFVVCLPVSEA